MAGLAAALALALAVAGGGSFQAPKVDRIEPVGGQRGTEVTVHFVGQRLFEPQGLMVTRPGLEVLEVTGDKPERCTVRLRIAADCALGPHALRLRTAFGIGNLVMFHVGALPEVAEQRAGDDIQVVPFCCTIHGSLKSEEVDRYAIELPEGASVQCEAQGLRLGQSAIDLALSAFDPEGRQIASADDTVLGIKDPMLHFVATRAGTYVLRIETAFADRQNAGAYRLHVGDFPRPTGCLPCGGQPGEVLEVTLLGADGSTRPADKVRVQLPEDPLPDELDDRFHYYVEDERGISPTPILLASGGPQNQTPTVDDQGRAWVQLPASVHGVIAEPDQVVCFYFAAKKGQSWDFRCVARSLRSPLDPILVLREADGRYLADNDDSSGKDSLLRFKADKDGDYRIEVRDLLRRGGPDYFFRLAGGERRQLPALRMIVGRDEEAVVSVARGNRMGAVLQCTNLDGKQQLELLARDLPAAVTATFGPVQQGTNLVPVILTAAADAEPSGGQVGFAVRSPGEPNAHDVSYAQAVTLVTARNNETLLATVTRRLPVAVTRPAPFTVRIDAPVVPIVRGAPLALTVHIERAEGFAEQVRVKALWLTPGLTAGQATIDGKQDSGTLPLSANGDALTGRFPFAVVAQANSRGGVVMVCSEFADLQVDEPWLTAEVGRARTEAGVATELRVKVKRRRAMPGPIEVVLLGLPRGVSCKPVVVDFEAADGQGKQGDERELAFSLEVAADAARGRHRSFLVQLRVPAGTKAETDATVEHRFGGGEIRIDAASTKVGEEQP